MNLITVSGVKGYIDENGTAWLNVDAISRGLGFTQMKDGVEYVRWGTVNAYLYDFGFSQDVGKEDFIPESFFYLLAMKASNQTAVAFQMKVANEILPSIRKTGSYSAKFLPQSNLKKLLTLVKTKREFYLLSGLPKQLAYAKALASVEQESGVDLSEFRPAQALATGANSLDINLILEAIRATIKKGAIYQNFGGGGVCALNRDAVYGELDNRGLPRKSSLSALWNAGRLERGGVHFTKVIRLGVGVRARAVFVVLDGEGESA